MKRIIISILTLLIVLSSCNNKKVNKIAIIPEPVVSTVENGFFFINDKTTFDFVNSDTNDVTIKVIASNITRFFNINQDSKSNSANHISFIINTTDNDTIGREGYTLDVTNNEIIICANTPAGLFYGYQTLFQLAPPDLAQTHQGSISIPSIHIIDYPRFEWRGTHLDVCRHFFDVDFVKKYIDILAMHKINKFHWHLTDDHGWRIQIDKYPKLTEIGAWSVDRSNSAWSEGLPPQPGEKATYGGYYTKEQLKDVVAYAKARNIDVIPEIEMPGHSSAILAAYPEYSCENDDDVNYYVQIGPYWPPVAILCAGRDETVRFMEDVLDEVMEIFPYEYIHAGGDEAFKTSWKKCPLCQKRIKDLGLSNEEELQSWFMKEIEKYLLTHNKKMIGWDEILEGGVSPSTVVMSWREEYGGIKAAQIGNHVIMAPNTYCYYDYYQADSKNEPLSIGGYVPLSKAYSFNPIPKELSADQAKLILGGQCNLWTEFIRTSDHVEYMLLPRLSALSECVWSPMYKKNWPLFQEKIITQEKRYEALGYKYSQGELKPSISSTATQDGKISIEMSAEKKDAIIHYTTNGSDPTKESQIYTHSFTVNTSTIIKAAVEYQGEMKNLITSHTVLLSRIAGKKIDLSPLPSEKYSARFGETLTDGNFGSLDFRDKKWLGFMDEIIYFTIKNDNLPFSKIFINTLISQNNWIFNPIEIEILSCDKDTYVDNKDFVSLAKETYSLCDEANYDSINLLQIDINKTLSPKYIRIKVTNSKKLPQWHEYSNNKPWFFIDEIWTE